MDLRGLEASAPTASPTAREGGRVRALPAHGQPRAGGGHRPIVAEVKQSTSSQSLDKAADDTPEAEQDVERAPTPGGGRPDSPGPQAPRGPQGAAGGEAVQRYGKEKRDAISLAIEEAIEEVKTRAIHSPYTPTSPESPSGSCARTLVPPGIVTTRGRWTEIPRLPAAPHPWAQSSSTPLHLSDPTEASTNKESRKSLASSPTYVEVPRPCDPEDLINGIIFVANHLGSTQLLSDKTPSKNVRMRPAQEAVSRIKRCILSCDSQQDNSLTMYQDDLPALRVFQTQ